jgi:hypothetical protein
MKGSKKTLNRAKELRQQGQIADALNKEELLLDHRQHSKTRGQDALSNLFDLLSTRCITLGA